jgi:hypothetical protein
MYELVLYVALALRGFSFWSMTKNRTLFVFRPYHYSFNDIFTYFNIVKYFLVKAIATEA